MGRILVRGTELLAMTLLVAAGCSGDSATAPSDVVLAVQLIGDGAGTVTSTPEGVDCSPDGGACEATFEAGTAVTLTATPASANDVFEGWTGACSGAGACSVTLDAAAAVAATFDDIALTTQAVGTAGGTVASPDGSLELVVPAGALSAQQEITVRRIDAADLTGELAQIDQEAGIAAAFELGPDGQSFAQPVEVAFATGEMAPATALSREAGVLLVQSGGTTDLVADQGIGVDASGELVLRGTLDHFSRLAATREGQEFSIEIPDAVGVGEPFQAVAFLQMTLALLPYLERHEARVTGANYEDLSPAPIVPSFSGPQDLPSSAFFQRTGVYNYTCTAEDQAAPFSAIMAIDVETEAGGVRVPSVSAILEGTIRCDPPPQHKLTVNFTGDGSGRVVSDPAGIDCASGESCMASFVAGTVVRLTATPDDGSRFCDWTGGGGDTQTSRTIQVTVNADGSVTACFEVESPQTERRLGLDVRQFPSSGGVISAGEYMVFFEEDGLSAGVDVSADADIFVDESRNVLGTGTGTRITIDARSTMVMDAQGGEAALPSDFTIDLQGDGNPGSRMVEVERRDENGELIDEQTVEMQNGLITIQGAPLIVLILVTASAFFDFLLFLGFLF